jgi:hypothetical protein
MYRRALPGRRVRPAIGGDAEALLCSTCAGSARHGHIITVGDTRPPNTVHHSREDAPTRFSKLLLAMAVSAVALTAFASTAAADSVSIAPGGDITAASDGRLTLDTDLVDIECDVILRGSLSTGRIAKVEGLLLGNVTAVTINNCPALVSASVDGLPWKLRYVRILGTLPNAVTGLVIALLGATFTVNAPIVGSCSYSGNPEATIQAAGSNPYTAGTISSDQTPLRLSRGGFLCPSPGRLIGDFTLSPDQTVWRL